MIKRIVVTLIVLIVTGVIVFNVDLFGDEQISGDDIAYAGPLADTEAYLPVVINRFKPQTEFGIEMYSINTSGGLDKMSEAGATFIRKNTPNSDLPTTALIWAAVEPTQGARKWSEMDKLETQLINASNRGMNVILVVRSTPPWARHPNWPNSPCGPIDPVHYQDFAKFMYDTVRRYSQPPYNVKHWEIYNEPDYPIVNVAGPFGEPHGCWGTWQVNSDPYGNGRAFGDMLNVVYPEMKKADPEAQVIMGGVLLECDPRVPAGGSMTRCEEAGHDQSHVAYSKFLEGILITGKNSLDGVNIHSYDFFFPGEPLNHTFGQYSNIDWGTAWNTSGPVTVAKVKYVKDLLNQYNVPGKDIYNTESGVLNSDPDFHTENICKPYVKEYEDTKASYIVQQFTHAKTLGIKTNIWFQVYGWRCTALLEDKDTTIQPAYNAYKFAAHKLGNSNFVREVTGNAGVKIFEFKYSESTVKFWVVWSLDGANHNINLSGTPSNIWDMAGSPKGITGNSFTATLTPHYIEY